ncbi:MAG: hypothetical protein EAZ85_03575 [Bacteroidetes bacterium]|nr:MAG: hypothetical protein EAZ85_03575 [Bacteroidota bacterium]TAG87390.1 MAG: hypothetical protein EAZ20_10745 [Bacteroidota bacterium]
MAKYLFYALACVPQANIVTNKSTPTTTACGTQAGANWLSKYIFFLNFKYTQNFYSNKNFKTRQNTFFLVLLLM